MYRYVAHDLRQAGLLADAGLATTTERHHIHLTVPPLEPLADASADLSSSTSAGAVFELASGLPSERHLTLIEQVVQAGRRAWVYWPAEQAVECVDQERLDSLRRHINSVKWFRRICLPVDRASTLWNRAPMGLRWIYRGEFPARRADILVKLTLLSLRAQPVPLPNCVGAGLYLRTDFWRTGGDDERMSRVVAELATISSRMVCLTARHDARLDLTAAQQVVMDLPDATSGEDAIVLAPAHYVPIVKAACQTLRPAYLYDRGAAGQSAGAELSQVLGIPYIVDYLGADVIVREALNGAAPSYPELYAKAEELALRQATVIIVAASRLRDELVSRGIDGARILISGDAGLGLRLAEFVDAQMQCGERAPSIETGDSYKDQVQKQWNQNPIGSQYVRDAQPHTLGWFLEVERHRYAGYAPWMPETMEFAKHAGHDVLEIGGGIGTDLAQFALNGAVVTDVDLAAGHLRLAEENFHLRGLSGRFIHHDAEALPFDDDSFDVVYSNGVLHHTPNTAAVIREMHRVLRPGGRAIVMLYAEHSLHYWRKLVWRLGVKDGLLETISMGEIMSRTVERSSNDARPLVKVYTRRRAERLFKDFDRVEVLQRQLLAEELPQLLRWTLSSSERRLGWNLIVKAQKSHVRD